MNSKFHILLVSCFISLTVFSQSSINNYKYVIVPNRYGFLKEANQYQLNELTEFLFEKYGFEALIEGTDFPDDLLQNRCLALNADVTKDSGLFKTKLTVLLKNCTGKTIFTSKVGESREKDYKTAYHLALRDAFTSIKALNYKYEPSKNTISATTATAKTENTSEIEKLKQEIEKLKEAKQTTTQQVSTTTPNAPPTETTGPLVLYAQEIENGFQLVDKTPKVVYRIKKTGRENLFLVEGQDAIIYKKDNNWVYEYNTNEGVKQIALDIKF